ncbi:HTH domain-containing protein [Virgibacillus sp. 179-BFC.A HS]|uniref:HTH domain-containing protein n=1 Tax=Tigheibacillus jepli TaxID=3035914 RepID=A0ABU5CII7_9BACI|nr:HTH domain-containing protein [Virgibacillus sp. 179-BFC.A HS]MDY0406140.1 HTH domain-containing protein [Virgibacillus sp. 179-BFC.A HS]
MYVSARERKILKHLLHTQTDTPVKEIADMLVVSERTAHRDLNNITDILADFHLKLVRKTGVGIRLVGSAGAKKIWKRPLVRFHRLNSHRMSAGQLFCLLCWKQMDQSSCLRWQMNCT